MNQIILQAEAGARESQAEAGARESQADTGAQNESFDVHRAEYDVEEGVLTYAVKNGTIEQLEKYKAETRDTFCRCVFDGEGQVEEYTYSYPWPTVWNELNITHQHFPQCYNDMFSIWASRVYELTEGKQQRRGLFFDILRFLPNIGKDLGKISARLPGSD